VVKAQVEVLEAKIEQVLFEKATMEISYSEMERAKMDMEDRLAENFEVLEGKIHRSDHNQAEYDKELEKLEEVLAFFTKEASGLRDDVLVLTADLKKSQKVSQDLASELTILLTEERQNIVKMEKDKRAIENTYQQIEKKNTGFLDKEALLTLQLKTHTKSYKTASESTESVQGKNQKLQQAVRKLESHSQSRTNT